VSRWLASTHPRSKRVCSHEPPAPCCLRQRPGITRLVSALPAHPREFALSGWRGWWVVHRTLLRATRSDALCRAPAVSRPVRTTAFEGDRTNDGFDCADPPRLRLEGPYPETNRPLTIHVALEAHRVGSNRPGADDLANLAAHAVALPLTPGTTFARPVKGRAQPAPDRLSSCRSRDVATSSHPRTRIRPRETESSTPVRPDLAASRINGGHGYLRG
jgi:hypothetical protein